MGVLFLNKIAILLKVAEMASFYESQGKTLPDAFKEVYKQFDYDKEALISKVFESNLVKKKWPHC